MEDKDLDELFGDDKQELHDKQSKGIVQNNDIVANFPPESNKALPTDAKLIKNATELSDEQKLLILKRWEQDPENPPSIEELCEIAYPGQSKDGRSREGRLIKKYLSELNFQPKTKTEYEKKGDLPLSNEQREFIKNNPNMRATEIACVIFDKSFLTALSQETRTVLNYQKELEKNTDFKKEIEDNDAGQEYRPPKTLEHACARINRNVDGVNYDSKKLTPTKKKQCFNLISYLHSYRFSHHYNLINSSEDRKLFENVFLKYIYNKGDLSQEDLDQYLALANEAVAESSIKKNILRLEQEQERSLAETGRLQMNLVDAMKVSRDEFNACRGRQDKLYKALEVERAKRLNERVGPQFTLLNIVEAMKNEERRRTMLEEAEKRNNKIKNELVRLSAFDEIVCQIHGIDEDLIING